MNPDPASAAGQASRAPQTHRPHGAHRWLFMTNHFLVLACVDARPDIRVREIAELVGITERATQAILGDLVEDGYVQRIRIGRRNRYQVRRSAALRHPLVSLCTVGMMLDALHEPLLRAI